MCVCVCDTPFAPLSAGGGEPGVGGAGGVLPLVHGGVVLRRPRRCAPPPSTHAQASARTRTHARTNAHSHTHTHTHSHTHSLTHSRVSNRLPPNPSHPPPLSCLYIYIYIYALKYVYALKRTSAHAPPLPFNRARTHTSNGSIPRQPSWPCPPSRPPPCTRYAEMCVCVRAREARQYSAADGVTSEPMVKRASRWCNERAAGGTATRTAW